MTEEETGFPSSDTSIDCVTNRVHSRVIGRPETVGNTEGEDGKRGPEGPEGGVTGGVTTIRRGSNKDGVPET